MPGRRSPSVRILENCQLKKTPRLVAQELFGNGSRVSEAQCLAKAGRVVRGPDDLGRCHFARILTAGDDVNESAFSLACFSPKEVLQRSFDLFHFKRSGECSTGNIALVPEERDLVWIQSGVNRCQI